jgi:recombination associated protein RdgC
MFKNARLFQLTTPFAWEITALAERLATRRFRPCGPLETKTLGWATLGGDAPQLVMAVNDCLLLCARTQERLLPTSAINEALEERISALESAETRTVGRAERRRLREQVITEMLPHAFTRSRRTQLYIDTAAGWVVIDAASEKQAEEVMTLLRETLETLPARLPDPQRAPATVMTEWLLEQNAPPDFVAGDACELRDVDTTDGVVRCRGQDLASAEILNHLRAGKQVTKLALDWNEQMQFILADDLSFKRIQMNDAVPEEENNELDELAQLAGEFSLFSLTMRELITRCSTVFLLNPQ